jgi:hypothetical protein
MKGQSPSLSWQAETEIDKITALRKSQQESNTYVPKDMKKEIHLNQPNLQIGRVISS